MDASDKGTILLVDDQPTQTFKILPAALAQMRASLRSATS
jgi:hypothetical protein